MDERILKKMLVLAEAFFGTAQDSSQIPITRLSFEKLQALHSKTVVYRLIGSEPVSWVVVLPTSRELASKFLAGQISERDLLEMTVPVSTYEALYLCAAFTVPEYRRKGYAVRLFREALDSIPQVSNALLFAWPYSEEGRLLIGELEVILGRAILRREVK